MQQNDDFEATGVYKKVYRQKRGIIVTILNSEPIGINHNTLAKKLSINRDTLRRDMNKLMDLRMVIREGKKGKYHLSKDVKSSDFAQGLILGAKFSNHILGKNNNILFTSAAVYNYNKKKDKKNMGEEKDLGNWYDFNEYCGKYIQPKFDENSIIEKELFEFINQIGAYFIFSFLMSLAFYDDPKRATQNNIRGKEWFEGTLNNIYIRIYDKFLQKFLMLYPNENHLKEVNKYIDENNLPKTNFVIKRTHIFISFFHLYPYIVHSLLNLKEELQDDVDYHKSKGEGKLIKLNKKNTSKV